MFERFTHNARAVVVQAHEVARRTEAAEVLPAHLFAALVEADGIIRGARPGGPRRPTYLPPPGRPRPQAHRP